MPFGKKENKASSNRNTKQNKANNMERLEVITSPKKRQNNQECGSDRTSSKRNNKNQSKK